MICANAKDDFPYMARNLKEQNKKSNAGMDKEKTMSEYMQRNYN